MRLFFFIAGFVFLAFIVLPMVIIAVSGWQNHKGKADIGVVLGTSITEDGLPAPYLKARLDEALAAYRQGFFPLVFVSGGAGCNGRTEAMVMAAYLVKHGVPANRIIQDPAGYNTAATAANLKKLMDERGLESAFVITQFFHMPRARLAMSCAGIRKLFSSSARYLRFSDLYSIFREVPAYALYWLKC